MYKAVTNRLLQAALFFGQLCPSINAICFPPPIGHYNTSIVTAELVDHSRLDPYASTPRPRSLMISLFKPVSPSACSLYQAPYMDPITAAFEDAEYAGVGVLPGSVEALSLEICQRNTRLELTPGHFVKVPTYPLILFSPGMGNTRLFYSAMARQYVFLVINSLLSLRLYILPCGHVNATAYDHPSSLHLGYKSAC